ncbi:hypothetical protein MKK55_11525 [Methylobacterium sp. J-059]|uniref:hypothetical protein n=1 Tax=Methylobacterium sp. J-059 TaxID=2836643 RepID=UPI001FBA8AA3|nr:hypothetical protein [Methylobacterium sp. J-059]MCJ2039566.1 hypothetical protein [Methylobacterium sp. J-059]
MSNVITFRPRAPQAQTPPAPSPAETRRIIEEAARTALDTADSLLAILDRMDGDAETEDAGAAEPAPAPIVAERVGAQVVSLRGPAVDLRPSAPESVLQDMPAAPTVLPFAPLPWRGAGNVVAAAGVMLLGMVGGR